MVLECFLWFVCGFGGLFVVFGGLFLVFGLFVVFGGF